MDDMMQIIGLVAGILALVVSLAAFIKSVGVKSQILYLEDEIDELTNKVNSGGTRKRKKRSQD